eukprot:TRINITY_DN14395_c0_g1_i1.p1 TRINITY_DN14395_c0_g1~~TRINITY_DN14395_c0_g1_i1.p1  ORF type:complete len:270 (+),score=25.46 TRINITY_DN14395_c0_g1_i1:46-855(+)
MSNLSLPPEVWCHILAYVRDIDDVVVTKRINRLFYNEMKDKDPLLIVPDVNWQALRGIIKYLSQRRLFTATREQVLEYWHSGEVNDVLRNAQSPSDEADRYFVFKTLLLSTPEVESAIYNNYQRAAPGSVVSSQFFTKLLTDDDIKTKLFMWDVDKSNTFEQIPPVYLNFANSLIMTFDVTKRSSFKLLIEGCIKIVGTYYSRKSTVPPLMYLVGLAKPNDESPRAVKAKDIELASKVFKLKYFEIDGSVRAVTDLMNTVNDDMQKSAA